MKRVIALYLTLVGTALAADAPQISRSVGEAGGVVVLWPRVVPATDAPEIHRAAAEVQASLKRLVAEALPDRPVDVRPAPERVCPQAGCKAMTVGALLVHTGQACAVVALVSGPGRSAVHLLPWAGKVTLKQQTLPFREYPESHVTILDFQRCGALAEPMRVEEGRVMASMKAVAGSPPAR